jgi:MraZ protein
MATFIGEYNCKIDEKGRLLLPMAFKKQMPAAANDTFVVKRDVYENCLVLFSNDEWERQLNIIRQKLNPYNREDMAFLRGLYKGTAEVALDNANRLLIPKRLLQEAGIDKEVVLAGQDGKIEMWSKTAYDKIATGDAFARLAEKIMGGNNKNSL